MTSHVYITINLFNLCQHFFLPFYGSLSKERIGISKERIGISKARIFLIKSADFHSSKSRIIFISKAHIYL
jgi:GTP cyclohydrolase I